MSAMALSIRSYNEKKYDYLFFEKFSFENNGKLVELELESLD